MDYLQMYATIHKQFSIYNFALQILKRHITATTLRAAMTNIGRHAGIDKDELAKAMCHSSATASRHYLANVNNAGSRK